MIQGNEHALLNVYLSPYEEEGYSDTSSFKYALLEGLHNMFGSEGTEHGLPSRRPAKLIGVGLVAFGLVAHVQNAKYAAPSEAAPRAKKSVRQTRRSNNEEDISSLQL